MSEAGHVGHRENCLEVTEEILEGEDEGGHKWEQHESGGEGLMPLTGRWS